MSHTDPQVAPADRGLSSSQIPCFLLHTYSSPHCNKARLQFSVLFWTSAGQLLKTQKRISLWKPRALTSTILEEPLTLISMDISIYGWFMCSQVTPVISERWRDLNSATNHRLQLPNANVATEPGQTEVLLNVNEWTKYVRFSQRKSKRYILTNSRFIFFQSTAGLNLV